MNLNKKKTLKVKCPHCEKLFSYYESDFRPFCSERCRMVDLSHWLSEEYSVPSQRPVDPDELITELEKERSKDES